MISARSASHGRRPRGRPVPVRALPACLVGLLLLGLGSGCESTDASGWQPMDTDEARDATEAIAAAVAELPGAMAADADATDPDAPAALDDAPSADDEYVSPWLDMATARQPASARGELLLAQRQCTNCHAADAAQTRRLQPLTSPRLDAIGARRSTAWLRRLLHDPRSVNPGGHMPDLLAGLPDAERDSVRDDLVAFLASRGGPLQPAGLPAEAWRVEEGQRLHEQLGCRACHAADEQASLSAATTVPALTAELRDPLGLRHAGGMPDMQLSDSEAEALATYLLADQHAAGPRSVARGRGLRVEVFELPTFPDAMPDWSALTPVAVDTVETIDVGPATRDDEFGLRFVGLVRVHPEQLVDGVATFWTRSDDGSRLWIDGQLVVDNDGLHSPITEIDDVPLSAGWHTLVLEFFEAGGGAEVDAGWVDPTDASPVHFRPVDLAHVQRRWGPAPEPRRWTERGDVERGRAHFVQLGCQACHQMDDLGPTPAAPDLDALGATLARRDLAAKQGRMMEPVPEIGCLAETPAPGLPRFGLSLDDRQHLARTLSRLDVLAMPATPAAYVDQVVALRGCTNCHARGSLGPSAEQRARFSGDHDLGDEGRVPPELTGVGARLRPAWLREVLADGAGARPYMHARMPVFGFDDDEVRRLAEAFALADQALVDEPEVVIDAELIEHGRLLAGRDGLSCVSCHTTLGHPGPGIPATDLADMHARLRPSWLRRWLADPIALRDGTRMPTFFDEGRSVLADVLDGDADAQIEALMAYLALGDQMPLPAGVLVDRAAYALVPVDRALPVAAFMEGLSARSLAIGHPERVHVAYDVHNVRLGLAWRGDFLDAEGTWRGRAGQLESPAGDHVRALPPGPAWARLDDVSDAWPAATGAAAGWRVTGQSRDGQNRPEFHSTDGDLVVHERVIPVLDVQDAVIIRRFRVGLADGAPAGRVWLRAAVDESIEPGTVHPRGAHFVGDDGLDVLVRGGEPEVVETDAGVELRIGLDLVPGPPLDLELELRW